MMRPYAGGAPTVRRVIPEAAAVGDEISIWITGGPRAAYGGDGRAVEVDRDQDVGGGGVDQVHAGLEFVAAVFGGVGREGRQGVVTAAGEHGVVAGGPQKG